VEEGYDRALASLSLSATGYRLEIALLLALAAPDAEARLRAGEPVFDRALPLREGDQGIVSTGASSMKSP